MIVWLMTVGEPLPHFNPSNRALRTQILAETLHARGHEVVWWTSTFDHFAKAHFPVGPGLHQLRPGYSLRFVHGMAYARNIAWQRFANHIQIARDFRAQAMVAPAPDIIVCSLPTLELAAAAVDAGKQLGCPVVLDVRDLWPDEIVDRFPTGLRWIGRLAVYPLARLARRAARGATAILGVSRAYLAWGLAYAGRSASADDQVIPLGHPGRDPQTSDHVAARNRLTALGVDPSKKLIVSIGTFGNSVDLGNAIAAARQMARTDVQFVFAGTGDMEAAWRAEAADLPQVIFTGWVGKAEIAALSDMAYAGLVAYRTGALIAMPNKIFEYMCYGLPLINALAGEAAELVEGEQIGLNYVAEDSASLAGALNRILDDPALRNQLSSNATATFAKGYSSASVYGRYADLLERLAIRAST